MEWGAGQLGPDDATAFPPDHLLELRVECEALTIREPTQRVPGPDRDLNGSRIRHTAKYTYAASYLCLLYRPTSVRRAWAGRLWPCLIDQWRL